MANKCLYCYLQLGESEIDFHPKCSRKIFGTSVAPELPYSEQELEPLARAVIEKRPFKTEVQ